MRAMSDHVKAEDVVLGHVEMSQETYAVLTPEERSRAWESMISELGLTQAYLPMPYVNDATHTVGMNLLGVEGFNRLRKEVERDTPM